MKKALEFLKATYRTVEKSLKDAIASAPPEIRNPAKKFLLIVIGLFIVITSYKFISNQLQARELAREIAAGPMVRIAKITKSPGEHSLTLLGETRPFQSVTLYAKVSGYLKSVRVDKGDVVKEGQVLAVIESPETDQAYEAALADARNKQGIAGRTMTLKAKGLVSLQEADQAQSDADVASARLRSQATQKGYETLRAPFPGVITARFADQGALVQNATSSQTSALPVVTVSQIKKLRVDVFIDQREAPFVEQSEPVQITVPERPGLVIQGRVDRLANELDARTKMLLTEIDIPNEERTLVAGSFVQVTLNIKSPAYLEAPVESLVLRANKPFLTLVTPENTLTYRPVVIASNDGKMMRLLSGVNEGENVALNIGDAVAEGGKVRPIVEEKPALKPGVSPSPTASHGDDDSKGSK